MEKLTENDIKISVGLEIIFEELSKLSEFPLKNVVDMINFLMNKKVPTDYDIIKNQLIVELVCLIQNKDKKIIPSKLFPTTIS